MLKASGAGSLTGIVKHRFMHSGFIFVSWLLQFAKWLLLGLGVQIAVLAFSAMCSGVWPRVTDVIWRFYWPVNWLTSLFIPVTSEADIGVGFVFLPPVMVIYASIFAAIVIGGRKLDDH